jgi:hypothetical protein
LQSLALVKGPKQKSEASVGALLAGHNIHCLTSIWDYACKATCINDCMIANGAAWF